MDSRKLPDPSNVLLKKNSQKQQRNFCFRTEADGSIPIHADWFTLFENLRSLEYYYLQTGHSCCRLIENTKPLEICWLEDKNLAKDKTGRLVLRGGQAFTTTGLVAHCDCCGSPGRIHFKNEYGLEIMQVCASSQTEACDWGSTIEKCCQENQPNLKKEAANHPPSIPCTALLHRDTHCGAIELLRRLFHSQVPFSVNLSTTGICHRTEIKPEYVGWNDKLFEVQSSTATLLLSHSAISGIYSSEVNNHWRLYIAAPGPVQLLAIGPPKDPVDRLLYSSVLSDLL